MSLERGYCDFLEMCFGVCLLQAPLPATIARTGTRVGSTCRGSCTSPTTILTTSCSAISGEDAWRCRVRTTCGGISRHTRATFRIGPWYVTSRVDTRTPHHHQVTTPSFDLFVQALDYQGDVTTSAWLSNCSMDTCKLAEGVMWSPDCTVSTSGLFHVACSYCSSAKRTSKESQHSWMSCGYIWYVDTYIWPQHGIKSATCAVSSMCQSPWATAPTES